VYYSQCAPSTPTGWESGDPRSLKQYPGRASNRTARNEINCHFSSFVLIQLCDFCRFVRSFRRLQGLAGRQVGRARRAVCGSASPAYPRAVCSLHVDVAFAAYVAYFLALRALRWMGIRLLLRLKYDGRCMMRWYRFLWRRKESLRVVSCTCAYGYRRCMPASCTVPSVSVSASLCRPVCVSVRPSVRSSERALYMSVPFVPIVGRLCRLDGRVSRGS